MPLRLLLHVSTTPASPSVGTQALKFARSNVMRSGVGRADYYQPLVAFTIGGVSRDLIYESLNITQNLNDQPDTMTVSAYGYTPTIGQEIVVGLGQIGNRVFAGHILSWRTKVEQGIPPIYELNCIDYTWELGHKKVHGRKFVNTPVNAIVASLVDDFAPNFTIYGRPFGYPAVDFESNDEESVPEAISRVVKMIDADWYVDANRKVHLFTNTEDAAVSFTNSTKAWDLEYSQDMSQIRSRTTARGQSTSTTSAVSVGATSMGINDTRDFGTSGGYAAVGANVISYTGKSVTEGVGNLTGIPDAGDYSIRYPIGQGESVRVFAIADDIGAQTRIASTLGSGHNGIIEHSIQDGNLGDAAARNAVSGDLMRFATEAEKQLNFTTRTKTFTLGRDIQANLTSPMTITGTYQIYRVTMSGFPGRGSASQTYFPERHISSGINRRDLPSLLSELA